MGNCKPIWVPYSVSIGTLSLKSLINRRKQFNMPLQNGSPLELLITDLRDEINSGDIGPDLRSIAQYLGGDATDEALVNLCQTIMEYMEIEYGDLDNVEVGFDV